MAFSRVKKTIDRIKLLLRNNYRNTTRFAPKENLQLKSRVYRGTNGWNQYSIPFNKNKNEGVYVNGFAPRGANGAPGTHDHVVGHIISSQNSRYVSYAAYHQAAKRFCTPISVIPKVITIHPAFVHEANIPLFHTTAEVVHVLAANNKEGIEAKRYANKEAEISGFEAMPAHDIAKSRQVDSMTMPIITSGIIATLPFLTVTECQIYAGLGLVSSFYFGKCYVGPVYENPTFKSRDFSFRIPSMNQEEYDHYIAVDKNMPAGYQAISYSVAKQLHPVLQEMEQFFADMPNKFGYHFIIDCVLKDDTADYRNTIALIQEVYYTMREATTEASFHTVKLSSLIKQATQLERSYNDFIGFFKVEFEPSKVSIEEVTDADHQRKQSL